MPRTPKKGGKKGNPGTPGTPGTPRSEPSAPRTTTKTDPATTARPTATPKAPLTAPWIPFLLVAVPAAHVMLAPYTKVEESFALHATHDVMRFGLNPLSWDMWDHRTFPGAVPRSFVPPIALAIASTPTAIVLNVLGLSASGVDVQQIVRLTLGLLWAYSMSQLSTQVKKRFGALTSAFFILLSVLQFHIPFYAGRTLPNFLALPFVNLSIAYTLADDYWHAIAILTAAATVIRLELALMVVPLAINLVVLKRISLLGTLKAGMAGGFGSLAIAAPIDYALWSPTLPHASLPDFTALHALWPELSAAWYNIVKGKADNWGVMPATFYFGALVKMLAGAFPLANLAFVWGAIQGLTPVLPLYENKGLTRTVGEVTRVLGPGASILVAALSNVGHKEWRFIVYVVPILNIVAAAGAAALWSLPDRTKRVVTRLAVVGLLGLTAAFSAFSTYASMLNYPGGRVWQVLDTLQIPENATIHYHSYPLQTGASLFTFTHADLGGTMAIPKPAEPSWVYSKDEDPALLDPQGAWDAKIDYVVTPDWDKFESSKRWKEVAAIDAFAGIRTGGPYYLRIAEEKKLAILQRVD